MYGLRDAALDLRCRQTPFRRVLLVEAFQFVVKLGRFWRSGRGFSKKLSVASRLPSVL